jgi:hypothetical protein
MSWIETCCSTAIGLAVAYLTQVLVFPLFDIHVSRQSHMKITAIFTIVSLIRSFAVRRLFNAVKG